RFYHRHLHSFPTRRSSDLTVISQTRIDLSWTDNSSDETNFRIERSPDGTSGWTEIATAAANATSYQNTGLTCGTPYYYRVRAYRDRKSTRLNSSHVKISYA